MKKPLVILISQSDWANVGCTFAKCLNAVGVDAFSYTKHLHAFEYPNQSIKYKNIKEVEDKAKQADAIIWMHSLYTPLDIDFTGKKLAVFNGGTQYRKNPNKTNRFFNPIVDVTFTQTAELLDKGAKNEIWLLPAVDIGSIEPNFTIGEKLVVGHFPSIRNNNLIIKGSSVINNVMKEFKDKVDYRFSSKIIPWKENLARMNSCDIYIESLKFTADWGVTSLEASALGNIVITDFRYGIERYKKEYGKCTLQVANTPEELSIVINRLLDIPNNYLLRLKEQTREWAINIHSLKAIGNRIVEGLEL